MGLPARLKHKLLEEERERDARLRQRQVEEECWRYESEARELLSRKLYHKAVKCLRKAVRLDPMRAVLHNDVGVVLSLQEKNVEAIGEYRTAVSLNERYPERRTDEWTTSYYNLGIAHRKAAGDILEIGQSTEAMVSLREARKAFEEYTRLNASGPKVHDARGVVEQINEQIRELEAKAATASEATEPT